MSDADFDPDDIADLDARFAKINKESHDGFYVEMFVTRENARAMIRAWLEAILGNELAREESLKNYGYLIEELMKAMEEDD